MIVKKESIKGLKRQIQQFDSTLDRLVSSAKKATESQKNAKRRTKKLLIELKDLKMEI